MSNAFDASTALEATESAISRGDFVTASGISADLLAQDPTNLHAAFLAGVAAARQGNAGLAIHHFRLVGRTDPTHWEALNWLCVLLRQTGDMNLAIACGRKACGLRPDSAECASNLGICYLQRWQFSDALGCFESAVRLDPELPAARHNLGVALEKLGRISEAEEAYRLAAQMDPAAPNPLVSLGSLLRRRGDSTQAASWFAEADARAKGSVGSLRQLALALIDDGSLEEAEKVLTEASAKDPFSVELLVLLGHAQQNIGKFKEAIACFETALELESDRVDPYFELVQCRKIKPADRRMIEKMESLQSKPHLSSDEVKRLQYALGKAYDDLGEYSKAFPHFQKANQLVYAQQDDIRLDRADLAAGIDRIVGAFTKEFFAANSAVGSQSELPILIVGMIRSGTTLIEQIISSHPEVGAGGELQYLLQNGAVLHPTEGVIAARAKSVAENYLNLLTSIAPAKSRVTDKMPNNYLMLGLVHLLFPKARIVHCRRDPADTCVSIYTTPYLDRVNFAHRPDEIAFNYEQYLRLMDHWRTVLPSESFLDVDYESLLEDREPVVRRLLDFCGLDWNDACMHHERRGGAVVTPSNWQVRQPIYQSSKGRWRHYSEWLPEFGALSI